jgi:hypothetical protein
MKRIIEGGKGVVYFFLPVSEHMTAALNIAKLAIFSLMGAAQRLPRNHAHVRLIINEAQSLLASGTLMQPLYQQMRKFGISIWTIHQCFQDLVFGADKNVLPMVVNNATVGIHLGVRDPIGLEHIEKIGGKKKTTRQSVNSEGKIHRHGHLGAPYHDRGL